MTETRLTDQKILGVMIGAGMLTPAQATRVEKLLDSGKALIDALQSVPLVDPLEFERARRVADGHKPTSPTPTPGADNRRPERPAREAPRIEHFGRDKDGIATLDLTGSDSIFPEPVHPSGEVELPRKPIAPSPKKPDHPEKEPLEVENWENLVAGKIESWPEFPSRPPIEQFDLASDEGIPLVRRLFDHIQRALASNAAALQFAFNNAEAAVAEYDYLGVRMNCLAEDPAQAEKITARLKVMARLSPWEKAKGSGVFRLLRKKVEFDVLVEVSEGPDCQRMTLFLKDRS